MKTAIVLFAGAFTAPLSLAGKTGGALPAPRQSLDQQGRPSRDKERVLLAEFCEPTRLSQYCKANTCGW